MSNGNYDKDVPRDRQTKKQNTKLLGWKTPQWDYEAIVTKAELGFVRLEIELRDRERVSECVCVTERE